MDSSFKLTTQHPNMPSEISEEELKAYQDDTRYACQFGVRCYQKNPAHHAKYKHPPKKQQKVEKKEENIETGKKRSSSECDDDSSKKTTEPQAKLKKNAEPSTEIDKKDSKTENDESKLSENDDSSPLEDEANSIEKANISGDSSESSSVTVKETEKIDDKAEKNDSSLADDEKLIQDLFLVKMPNDFYKFYEFCKSLSSKDPTNCLKLVDLKLVGPYDVLAGRISIDGQEESEKYLRHWRYYYDPPEFQTILAGNEKDALHYGYWRDVIEELPIFVAKNSANQNCNIVPVAPNIFGAVNKHIEEKASTATPFEKGPMIKLSKQLKTFAKNNDISVDNESTEMRNRARKVVAKTFHGAGIVVPYDKKTQIGYRDLAATDSQIKKILKKIDEAETDEERKKSMVALEEIMRLATIAADECDFGTCLELGHDLFASGSIHVERMGMRMLAAAYNLLNRKNFLKIAEAHAKDRKKGSNLDVV